MILLTTAFFTWLSSARAAPLSMRKCQTAMKDGNLVLEYDLDVWSLYGTEQIECACRPAEVCRDGPAYFSDESSCLMAMKKQFRCADVEATAMSLTEETRTKSRSNGNRADWQPIFDSFSKVVEEETGNPEWKSFFSGLKDNIATYKASDETPQTERVATLVDSILGSVSARQFEIKNTDPPTSTLLRAQSSEVPFLDLNSSENNEEVDNLLDSIMGSVTDSVSSYYEVGIEDDAEEEESVATSEDGTDPEENDAETTYKSWNSLPSEISADESERRRHSERFRRESRRSSMI